MAVLSTKLIFFVASLCVVNASVITVNVFDDDPETEVTRSNQKDCNFRACDQRCRNMGFPSGVCVNGRCKCDNFLGAEVEYPETAESFSTVEEPISLKSCNMRACDQLCRRLKFKGGVCVNGRCKCDLFLNAEDGVLGTEETLPSLEEPISPKSCNYQACDQLCRRLKFKGGACVNGRCKCDLFLNIEGEDFETAEAFSTVEEPISPKSCNYQACDQLCRRLKFKGGACVNGRCKCDLFLNAEEDVSIGGNFMSDPTDLLQRTCNLAACTKFCHQKGLPYANCVKGNCRCRNFLSAQETALLLESVEAQAGRCFNWTCNSQCRRRGFNSGTCDTGRCKCKGSRNKTESAPSTTDDVYSYEPEESNFISETKAEKLSTCNPVRCNDMCRRLKYIGGMCRGGTCQCY